jgi:hypothetical protein
MRNLVSVLLLFSSIALGQATKLQVQLVTINPEAHQATIELFNSGDRYSSSLN